MVSAGADAATRGSVRQLRVQRGDATREAGADLGAVSSASTSNSPAATASIVCLATIAGSLLGSSTPAAMSVFKYPTCSDVVTMPLGASSRRTASVRAQAAALPAL
ncbi:MAG: hypothetical protein ABS81_19925 [Pseudonocardia sp. SCN 72-86]|nr:MAG: hypothetical protein ABS81_19925 [Pseudonocardia sp. SCN 72-86]